MISSLKRYAQRLVCKIFSHGLKDFELSQRDWLLHESKWQPATKITQRTLFNFYQQLATAGTPLRLSDTGFRVFSQFEEDGILLYLFAVIGIHNSTFVDIGASDGINSNCANLAINFGWRGLFIDGDKRNIERGTVFYANHPDTWAYPPQFVHALVQRENVNDLIAGSKITGVIDLLSIDIDGNDYWIWDALTVIEPRVVVIETHTEFGLNNIVVPYDKDYAYPGRHPDYHGASPIAMARLAEQKGYRLVGAINYGFNTFYVRNGVADDAIPAIPVESILVHPRNRQREILFEPIKDWDYVTV